MKGMDKMKEVIIIILDKFADWEVSFVSLALNSKEFTLNYSIKYASVDKKTKTSIGNLISIFGMVSSITSPVSVSVIW